MQATAQILSHVSKMDQRLKRTDELFDLMEKNLFGDLPFKSDDQGFENAMTRDFPLSVAIKGSKDENQS